MAVSIDGRDVVEIAVERAAEQFTFGDVVSKEWLLDAFGIRYPKTAAPAEIRRLDLAFLECFERFAATMLHEHRMALWSKRNGIWMVLHPRDQAREAATRAVKEVRKAVRRGVDVAEHTNVDALSATEAAAHSDAQAKLANFAMLVRKGARRVR
jgi:hypothetical protein